MKKTVLFGAGQAGAMAARLLGGDHAAVCFADNAPEKRGGSLAGLPIGSPEEALALGPDCVCLCVLDAERASQMEAQLRALGYAGPLLRAGELAPFDARAATMRLLAEQILELGIPGDAVTSVLIGGLTIQGLTPGSLLFTEHMDVVIGIFTTMFIATILMVLMQLFGMRLFIMVLNVPTNYLNSALVILSLVGSYALRNNIFDVAITIVLGLVGYLMQRGGFPTAPAVLGLVLGVMFEREVRMALQTSHNDWTIFLTRPVACVFVVLSVLFVANSLWKAWKDSKAEKAKAQA